MIFFLIFILGASVGSFLNVALSRRNWYKGRSRCDNCGYTLKWYDLIPIVSYLFLGGRCRKCKTKIDPTHLFSELLMGCTFLCASFCFSKYALDIAVLYSVGFFFLSFAAIEDIKEKMIYSWILYSGIFSVLIIKLVQCVNVCNWTELLSTVTVVVTFKIFSLVLSKLIPDKIGNGDFDIFIIMIIILGTYNAIIALTISCAIGIIAYLPSIVLQIRDKNKPIAFVPLLYIGTLFIMVCGGVM